jgi:hypothetical protein
LQKKTALEKRIICGIFFGFWTPVWSSFTSDIGNEEYLARDP